MRHRNSDASIRALERRWRETGDRTDLAAWRKALNRTGQAPPGETFYRDVLKRAAQSLAMAARMLSMAANELGQQTFDAAVTISIECRAYAAACRSASTRLLRERPPAVSLVISRADHVTPQRMRRIWQDLMADASDSVAAAEGLLRDIAFDVERNDYENRKVVAKPWWDAVLWLVDLRSAISHSRDRYGGHDGRSWWARHGPLSADANWWRREGTPIPQITDQARSNPDADLRALERRYLMTRDLADAKALYVAAWRAGARPALPPDVEFEIVEAMHDAGEITSKAEARERHEARIRAGSPTRREVMLKELFGERGPAAAPLMRWLEADPSGSNSMEAMEQIAQLVGADRGVDSFDADDADGRPLYLYVAWEDWGKPTLFWSFDRDKFEVATTNRVAERVWV